MTYGNIQRTGSQLVNKVIRMFLRTKLHRKTTIHEYDHEFTNDEATIRLFVKIRGRQPFSTFQRPLSSFLLSMFFLRDLCVTSTSLSASLCGEK